MYDSLLAIVVAALVVQSAAIFGYLLATHRRHAAERDTLLRVVVAMVPDGARNVATLERAIKTRPQAGPPRTAMDDVSDRIREMSRNENLVPVGSGNDGI